MESALAVQCIGEYHCCTIVSILVIMESALADLIEKSVLGLMFVSILVIMESALAAGVF